MALLNGEAGNNNKDSPRKKKSDLKKTLETPVGWDIFRKKIDDAVEEGFNCGRK